MDKIIHGVRNLNDFITQLLTFAKILQVHPKNLDLEKCIDKAMLYSGVDTTHAPVASLHMQKDLEGLVALCSDPDLIQQMLLNLLLNAMDVVDTEGRVTIRVREYPDGPGKGRAGAVHSIQSIHFDGARRHVGLAVMDSGPGIEADIAEKLFTPFFTTKATGTGIGLSMVS